MIPDTKLANRIKNNTVQPKSPEDSFFIWDFFIYNNNFIKWKLSTPNNQPNLFMIANFAFTDYKYS